MQAGRPPAVRRKLREHGVAMHLWVVQAADGAYSQSEELVAEADERQLLDRAWLTRAVTAAAPAPDVPAQPVSGPSAPAEPSGSSRSPDPSRTPTPADVARAVPPATVRRSSDAGWADPDEGIPLLDTLSTPQQVWADRGQDLSVSGEPQEAGSIFAARRAGRLPRDQAADLLARPDQAHPRIPRSPDGELLRHAARFGTIGDEELDISDGHRAQLRAGFWSGIAQPARSLSVPTPWRTAV
jgi:hypothetical protein